LFLCSSRRPPTRFSRDWSSDVCSSDLVSQLGAWASKQSDTLESREAFEQRMAELEAEFAGRQVPRPPRWTGLRVHPGRIEFWYGAQYRLHERWLYEFDLAGQCSKRMLYP